MGKKKNSMFSYNGGQKDDYKDRDHEEKKKKDKRSKESQEILSRSKPTLSKRESALIAHAMARPAKLEDEARKLRRVCNHQQGVVSLRDLDKLGMQRSYIPFLDQMLKQFGENKVGFCSQCFDAMVAEGAFTVNDAWKAICTLYAMANYVESTVRLDKKEIAALSDLQETLVKEWAGVVKMFSDATDKKQSPSQTSSDSRFDAGSLN